MRVHKRENLWGKRKGERTPEMAFKIPILKVINSLGGRARVSDILRRVEEQMRGVLNEYDYEPLPKSGEMRWRNTARWCRNTMVNEGLLRHDSPRGIWEITEKGRRYLKEHEKITIE